MCRSCVGGLPSLEGRVLERRSRSVDKERIEMLLGLLVGAMVFFALCYKLYGDYMSRIYGLSDSNKTPAEAMYDGVDYCPAH